jgi:hypothetical protein
MWQPAGARPDAPTRWVSAEIYGPSFLLVGRIRMSANFRLTDVANESEAFLELSEMEVTPYLPETPVGFASHPAGLVNKNYIGLLAETSAAAPAAGGLLSRQALPADLVVEKEKRRVLLYTPSFAVNADIHVVRGANVSGMLANLKSRFLPVTNVSVLPTLVGGTLPAFRREFMLVNREQVIAISVTEGEGQGHDRQPAGSEGP